VALSVPVFDYVEVATVSLLLHLNLEWQGLNDRKLLEVCLVKGSGTRTSMSEAR
jgi:hypothetical protein